MTRFFDRVRFAFWRLWRHDLVTRIRERRSSSRIRPAAALSAMTEKPEMTRFWSWLRARWARFRLASLKQATRETWRYLREHCESDDEFATIRGAILDERAAQARARREARQAFVARYDARPYMYASLKSEKPSHWVKITW